MNILVTGAYGFIGRQVVAGLLQAGHSVVCGVRKPEPSVFASQDTVVCDFAHDTQPEDWLPRLSDIDVVVNCAGILREVKDQTFDAVHRAAPGALFYACTQADVKWMVQVSALGSPEDGGFIRSRHAADAYLVSLPIESLVVRPSVVYSTSGSYGGTSLMRALSSTPWVLEAVGPEPVTFREYLLSFRRWLGVAPPAMKWLGSVIPSAGLATPETGIQSLRSG